MTISVGPGAYSSSFAFRVEICAGADALVLRTPFHPLRPARMPAAVAGRTDVAFHDDPTSVTLGAIREAGGDEQAT